MEDRLELTDHDITEATSEIAEITIPAKVIPAREWIAKQLHELATRVIVETEITNLELKWSLTTNQCIITIQLNKAQ